MGKRGEKRKFSSCLSVPSLRETPAVASRNFSASLPTAVLRDCNNTDLPHRDVVRLFMCKVLGKVQRDGRILLSPGFDVIPCPQTPWMG